MDQDSTFHISSHTREGWTVLDMRGDIDLHSAPLLRKGVLERTEVGDARIILNMEHVDFLDSTGLSAIITGLRATRALDGNLVLVRTTPQVQRLLDLTHLDEVLRVFPSVDEAIAQEVGKA